MRGRSVEPRKKAKLEGMNVQNQNSNPEGDIRSL